MAVLVWNSPTFLTVGDEEICFDWIARIKAIRRWEGVGIRISIHVKRPVSHHDLREMIALFWRYDIEMTQLAKLRTSRNESWFADPKKYWHRHVFSNARRAGGRSPRAARG